MNDMAIKYQPVIDGKPVKTSAKIIQFPQNKNKGGRPSRYTNELAEEICAAVMGSDKGIERLCKDNESWPSKKTIFNWLNKHDDFQRRYKLAKEFQIECLMDELLHRPFKWLFYIDKCGNRRIQPVSIEMYRLESDILKWKIAHLMPRTYDLFSG
jgi:hypothetical protein